MVLRLYADSDHRGASIHLGQNVSDSLHTMSYPVPVGMLLEPAVSDMPLPLGIFTPCLGRGNSGAGQFEL